MNMERGVFAKVCFEIDLSCPLATGINVRKEEDPDTFQPLVYEQLPKICYGCGRVGHQLINYGLWKSKLVKQTGKPFESAVETNEVMTDSVNSNDSMEPIYGSWIQVSRRERQLRVETEDEGRKEANQHPLMNDVNPRNTKQSIRCNSNLVTLLGNSSNFVME